MNPGAIIHDLLQSNPKTDERKEIDGDIFPRYEYRFLKLYY